jgi:hypothetical protein
VFAVFQLIAVYAQRSGHHGRWPAASPAAVTSTGLLCTTVNGASGACRYLDMRCVTVQAVSASTRTPNAADVLKSAGVHHLDADLADTVLSLRMYQPQ